MLTQTHKLVVLLASAGILVGFIAMVEARGDERERHSMVEDVAALGGETADRPAPDWSLPTREGSTLSLRDLRGKVVFLNFWASWCPPCVEEMPSMEQLARKYQGRDLVMVAVSQDDSAEAVEAFLNSSDPSTGEPIMPSGPVTMRVALDPSAATSRSYGTERLPETYIIDREGRVVARFVNKYDWGREEVDRFIERLLRQ